MGKNEIEQVGFRLAKQQNLPTLHPIDFPMFMSGLTPNEVENPKPNPQTTPKPSNQKPVEPAYVAKGNEILRTGTILEALRYSNSDEYIQASHYGYMEMLLPTESPAIYSRADLLTNWYKRNLRMFANINRITEFPNDRVLLIVGSGHLKILRDFAVDSPQFCFVDTNVYLK